MKILEILFILSTFFLTEVYNYAQTNITKAREEFVYEDEDEFENNSYDDLYYQTETNKRKLIAKLFDKIDLLTNDSLSFVKFQFSDEGKKGNNGYVFLSNEKELDSFISDLITALEKLSHNEDFQSQSGKYKIDVIDKILGNKTVKTINFHETMSGTAYISLNKEGALKLLDWIKFIEL